MTRKWIANGAVIMIRVAPERDSPFDDGSR
jgi:hypothetical protein